MIIRSVTNNEADLSIEAGETVYFRGSFLRGRCFGFSLVPPFPWGSPIARLIHGCYFMNSASSDEEQSSLQLNGDSGLGKFMLLTLGLGDRYFVNPRYIAAFSFSGEGGFHTQLQRLWSPSCWGIHHPLPVIAHGPGNIVIYAENLRVVELESEHAAEYIPNQVVAFDCKQPFAVKALRPDRSPISQIINALIDDNRMCFDPSATLYISPINHPVRQKLGFFIEIVVHVALLAAVFYVLRGR
jgi:hypothetical protein